jgi:hypothetical protein
MDAMYYEQFEIDEEEINRFLDKLRQRLLKREQEGRDEEEIPQLEPAGFIEEDDFEIAPTDWIIPPDESNVRQRS